MCGIDAEMLAQMNTKMLAVQVSTGTQYCGAGYCGAGVSSRVRYPPAGPEGRLRQAIRPGRRVHDLRHDVAVNFGILSEQPETTLWVIAIGSTASLFVHARCDQYDPCVFKIRVVAVDEVHFTSDWHAISDVGRDCLGGLSRAIDQNDFACAAAHNRSHGGSAADAACSNNSDLHWLEKIPQSGEFNDLLSRQDSGDQFCLRSGVDFVQMT